MHSPVWLQNAGVTMFGAYRRWLRYGGSFGRNVLELAETEFYSREELEALQLSLLKPMIAHAYHNTPFYRRYYDTHGVHPDSIQNLHDLERLPLVRKEQLRRYHSEFLPRGLDMHTCWVGHTSGTTGTPLRVVVRRDAVRFNYALWHRARVWAGVSPGDKSASFGGRVIVPGGNASGPFWRYNLAQRQLYFSIFHMSDATLDGYVRRLARFRPAEIVGYPSAIDLLARHMNRTGDTRIRPQAVLTNAETLLDRQRDEIERAFHCRVFDNYGAEYSVFVGTCPQGGRHLFSEFGVMEILKDGMPAPPGVEGDVVVTGLRNDAMPLIRYCVGDVASLLPGVCWCGRAHPRVGPIVGRVEDFILTPDGRAIGRLDGILKGASNIIEAQLVQQEMDRLTLKVVPAPECTEDNVASVVHNLRLLVGPGMDIETRLVQQIERAPSGKFRFVVSHVPKALALHQPMPGDFTA
jgi:phenylacetate-CoA ligase